MARPYAFFFKASSGFQPARASHPRSLDHKGCAYSPPPGRFHHLDRPSTQPLHEAQRSAAISWRLRAVGLRLDLKVFQNNGQSDVSCTKKYIFSPSRILGRSPLDKRCRPGHLKAFLAASFLSELGLRHLSFSNSRPVLRISSDVSLS